MAEQTLFSKFVGNLGETDSLFVQLTTETQLSVANIVPLRLELTEMFSTASPIVVFEFTDGNGDLFNHIKPTPDIKFFLNIGSNFIDSKRIELRCVKTAFITQKQGSSDQMAYKMFFSFHGWSQITNIRHNRAWDNILFSDIVKQMAAEAGYNTSSISPTETSGHFIQPHWTNMQAIKFLRRRSSSPNGGHMEYGATLDGRFIFKSTGDMITEQTIKARNRELPLFKLEGQIGDPVLREDAYKNNKAPTNFYTISGEEEYMDAVVQGGGGCRAFYYDSSTDTFNDGSVLFSNLETPQMTDWGSIAKMDENTGYRMFGGRDSDVMAESKNKVIDLVDSVNRFMITVEKTFDIHIGDMVEVIIPTPPSVESIVPQNVFYSGFYLICGISTVVNFNKSTVSTNINLMREGFDGKELTSLHRSLEGKFLK